MMTMTLMVIMMMTQVVTISFNLAVLLVLCCEVFLISIVISARTFNSCTNIYAGSDCCAIYDKSIN